MCYVGIIELLYFLDILEMWRRSSLQKEFSLNKCEFHENERSRCGDVVVDAGFLRDTAAVCRDTILCRRVSSFSFITFDSVRY